MIRYLASSDRPQRIEPMRQPIPWRLWSYALAKAAVCALIGAAIVGIWK